MHVPVPSCHSHSGPGRGKKKTWPCRYHVAWPCRYHRGPGRGCPALLTSAGEKAAGAKMSGPPPGLQRKNAMDADAKAVTIKVTLWL